MRVVIDSLFLQRSTFNVQRPTLKRKHDADGLVVPSGTGYPIPQSEFRNPHWSGSLSLGLFALKGKKNLPLAGNLPRDLFDRAKRDLESIAT